LILHEVDTVRRAGKHGTDEGVKVRRVVTSPEFPGFKNAPYADEISLPLAESMFNPQVTLTTPKDGIKVGHPKNFRGTFAAWIAAMKVK